MKRTLLLCLLTPALFCAAARAAEDAQSETGAKSRVRLYSRQIDAKKDLPQSYAGRALAYAELGDPKKAALDVEAALKLSPKLPEAFKARGELRLGEGKLDEALADFSKAARLAPSQEAYMDRGRAYAALGMADEAIADYNAAEKLDPSTTRPAYARARLYTRTGNYQKMYEEFDGLVNRNPGDPISINNRGYAAMWIGKWARAKEDFLKAISIEKSYPAAHVNLADFYWAKGRNEKLALENLATALEMGYANIDSLTDEKRDGYFLKGLTEKDAFRKLVEKYKGKQ
ncbi:MAG: tetratricopeptide repeat protein [Elusimicrobia bacterium]|nr:tetratricopeptide repeat protein [Elusimicrobiota bacterium]